MAQAIKMTHICLKMVTLLAQTSHTALGHLSFCFEECDFSSPSVTYRISIFV